jgi:hypothetical protein
MGGFGYSDFFVVTSCIWVAGQRSERRIGIFKQCFVVSSCLLIGQSAVRWADLDDQTVFCGEQLPFGWSVSVLMGEFVFSDSVFFG